MLVTTTRITLIGRPGCHLCDDAREVVEDVAAELGVGWVERSIDDDLDLREPRVAVAAHPPWVTRITPVGPVPWAPVHEVTHRPSRLCADVHNRIR